MKVIKQRDNNNYISKTKVGLWPNTVRKDTLRTIIINCVHFTSTGISVENLPWKFRGHEYTEVCCDVEICYILELGSKFTAGCHIYENGCIHGAVCL